MPGAGPPGAAVMASTVALLAVVIEVFPLSGHGVFKTARINDSFLRFKRSLTPCAFKHSKRQKGASFDLDAGGKPWHQACEAVCSQGAESHQHWCSTSCLHCM